MDKERLRQFIADAIKRTGETKANEPNDDFKEGMYDDLWDFLERAALDDVWVEVNTKSYGVFKSKSAFLDEAEDELGWTFTDARHENYGSIYFNDILSVKRLDTGEIFVQPQ